MPRRQLKINSIPRVKKGVVIRMHGSNVFSEVVDEVMFEKQSLAPNRWKLFLYINKGYILSTVLQDADTDSPPLFAGFA